MAHATQKCLWLLALPIELLADIFSSLDCINLLACKQVCRLFNDLITCTADLRLIIELHAAGQEKGPTNTKINPTGQLDALKQWEAAWDKLKWSKEGRVPMLNGGLWELYGGVLAQSDGPNITFRRLPSIHRSIEEAEWTVGGFGHPIRDFSMDPAQDLLVLLESPRWSGPNPDHSYHLHLRTMSTGGPHPKAPNPPIISYPQTIRDTQLSYTVQISAQHLGILFHNSAEAGQNELAVWEWTSGAIEAALIGDQIQSFTFLSESHILMALLAVPDPYEDFAPSLMVLNFKTESNERHTVEEVEHAYLFCYPPLGASANPLKLEIRSDPSPSWAPDAGLHVPFYTAKYNRVYVISLLLLVPNRLRSVVLLVPSATFLSCINGSSSHRPVNVFQWSDWGPRGTRMLMPRIPPSEVWVCYVYGSNYVALRKDKERFVVDIFDFNQRALFRALQKPRDAVPEDETYAINPSIFEEGEIFGTQVETSLPYRIRTFSLDLRSIAHIAIVCSEDSLIIVDSHHDRREFRILTF